jgi:DHA1 family bicyclomycin/chloramphenicol resistance-like MFS transporter
MISPIVGGILIDAFGWRSVFGFALLAAATILTGAYLAIYETRPPKEHGQSSIGIRRSYLELFSHARFAAFVLQSGFSTGTFMTVASASPTLMRELLHRPATEFGFYFAAFPVGFFCGNLIASRLSGRVAAETMVLTGSCLLVTTVVVQATLLFSGHLSPLTLFLPGFFITMSQGIALPNGQAAAIATVPRLAGTAAGVGVFTQQFCGASFAQLYGFVSDGTPTPMMVAAMVSASLCLMVGSFPFIQKRLAARPGHS